MGFGEQIRKYRKQEGLSLGDAAKGIGISAAYLCDLEYGRSWEEYTEMISSKEWAAGPEGTMINPLIVRKHRRCRNCKVKEVEYDDITKKWRRE